MQLFLVSLLGLVGVVLIILPEDTLALSLLGPVPKRATACQPTRRAALFWVPTATILVGPAVANAFLEEGAAPAMPTPTTPLTRNTAGQFLLESGNIKRNSQALEEIKKQQALQDEKLEQCREDGKNWDQCFFYGRKQQQQRSGSDFFQFDESSLTKLLPKRSTSNSSIPAW